MLSESFLGHINTSLWINLTRDWDRKMARTSAALLKVFAKFLE